MRVIICSAVGEPLRTEDRVPVCGEDFCDRCGDCLVCYGCEICPVDDDLHLHRWVIYEGDDKR